MGTERTLLSVVERMLLLVAEDSQLGEGKLRNQQLVVSVSPSERDTAATSQLPVRTERSAQTQLEPMLDSMAVAETEQSAPVAAKEALVQTVQSEPERKVGSAAFAAVGVADQVCENTARHLLTASDEML